MRLGLLPKLSGAEWKGFFSSFVLVLNSFAWYSVIYAVFVQRVNSLNLVSFDSLLLFAVFYAGIAGSAILVSRFIKDRRYYFLLTWITFGVFSSFSLGLLEAVISPVRLCISLFLGISIGMGLPSCFAYFADSTKIEHRGLLGGFSYGFSGIAILLLAAATSVASFSEAIVLLTAWRFIGLTLFAVFGRPHQFAPSERVVSYSSILTKRRNLLYLAPWVMFCLINWIEAPIIEHLLGDFYDFSVFVGFALIGVVAFFAGFLTDHFGRKRVATVGFVMLGIEYAVLSLLSGFEATRYVYLILDSSAWGILSVVFFMVVWGDLAENVRKEQYYVIGGLPYILAGFMSILVKPYVEVINLSAAFSLASFFLFLAVLPLMYVSETLPEKRMKEMELRSYVEKAMKIKEKLT